MASDRKNGVSCVQTLTMIQGFHAKGGTMNIDHLREFSFLADSLNFSATAKHFFLSQSVLSKHIAAMEDELHTKLFERNSHKVSLTEQGKIFQKDAEYIVRRYENTVTHLRCIEEGER